MHKLISTTIGTLTLMVMATKQVALWKTRAHQAAIVHDVGVLHDGWFCGSALQFFVQLIVQRLHSLSVIDEYCPEHFEQ